MDAFYRLVDGLFHSTPLTTGPWDVRAQHGGPPTALLVRAAERTAAELDLPHLARITVELLAPVPVAPLAVRCEIQKRGRSAARLMLELVHEARTVARASALCLRTSPLDVELAPEPLAAPQPDGSPAFDFPFFQTEVGYHTAIELRLARGTFGATPTFMWMRARVPLVEGEPLTGTQRVALSADSGNGVSPILDWTRHDFINPDLTVALHRAARGEWIGLDARTTIEPSLGLGTAQTRIWDLEGPVGYGIQSLLCNPRTPS